MDWRDWTTVKRLQRRSNQVQVDSGAARQPSGAGDAVTLAEGDSTVAAASGGAMATVVAKQGRKR
jgi:hypothetical protein